MSNRVISLLSNNTLLNSKVVTVTVKPDPGFLSTPVEIEFPHLHNVSSDVNKGCSCGSLENVPDVTRKPVVLALQDTVNETCIAWDESET